MSATPGYLQLFQMQIIHLNSLNFILQTQGPTVQICVFAWFSILVVLLCQLFIAVQLGGNPDEMI